MTAMLGRTEAWELALEFLGEAESVGAAQRPRLAMHAAYYSMFHGARAALLGLDGPNAPSGHAAVVGRFGFHAKRAGDAALTAAAHVLNEAQDLRNKSDYRGRPRPDTERVVLAVAQARAFLATCAAAYDLPLPPQVAARND